MIKSKVIVFICFLILFSGAAAIARDSGGMLSFIISPSSTEPIITEPGGTITIKVSRKVHDSCSCAFYLYIVENGKRVMLSQIKRVKSESSGENKPSTYTYSATVPSSVEPGFHTLEAKKGGNHDFNDRAILVRKEPEATGKVIHIHDPRIQKNQKEDPGISENIFKSAIRDANELMPDAVLISGVIAENNRPDEYQSLLDMLSQLRVPSIVSPQYTSRSENYFGDTVSSTLVGNNLFVAMSGELSEEESSDSTNTLLAGILENMPPDSVVFILASDSDFLASLKKTDIDKLSPAAMITGSSSGDGSTENSSNTDIKIIFTPPLSKKAYSIIELDDKGVTESKQAAIQSR